MQSKMPQKIDQNDVIPFRNYEYLFRALIVLLLKPHTGPKRPQSLISLIVTNVTSAFKTSKPQTVLCKLFRIVMALDLIVVTTVYCHKRIAFKLSFIVMNFQPSFKYLF